MAIRVPSTLSNQPVSPAAFSFATGATIVGWYKRNAVPADPTDDQAICTVRPAGGSPRHELQIDAAGNVRGRANWYGDATGNLLAYPGGYVVWAIRMRVDGTGNRLLKFYVATHPSGASFSEEIGDAGGGDGSFSFALGEGVDPWVAQGDGDFAYLKTWQAALTDAQIAAEMGAFAQLLATGKYSYLTGVGKANAAAAVVDESGGGHDWTLINTGTTVNDTANPAAFGGTPPTIAIGSATASGATVSGAGTLTSTAGTPTISCTLQAGASGTTQGPVAATIAGSNWTVSFPNVPAGVYQLRATISNTGGSALAVSADVEILGLSGSGELPSVYAAGAISMTPESVSLAVAGTQVLTIVDQSGLPLDGVVCTSTAPAVATVTSPSNAQGQVTVTGVSTGAATIQASYSDPISGQLADSTAIAVALATPAAPTTLTAVPLGSTAVRLAYTDNSANETGFIVERAPSVSGAPGTFATILTPAAGVTTVDDTTVVAGQTYFYRVRANNASGASAPSNTVSVGVPVAADAIPPSVTLGSSGQSVTVPNSVITLTAVATDNVGVTEVRFYRNGTQVGAALQAPNAGANYQLTQTFASAQDNGSFTYTARAFDAAGNSTLSGAVTVNVNIAAAQTAPAAPSALKLSQVTQTSQQLDWTNNATNATAVLVERAVGAGGTWEQVIALASTVATWVAAGLLSNQLYRWRVRAQGAELPSGYSNEASGTTLAPDVTGLASLVASAAVVSEVSGRTATVTYTALDGNGSSRPGVTISPVVANPAVATVSPANGITDGNGRASFVVTFADLVGQTQLLVSASDGAATLSPPATPMVEVFTLPVFTEALVRELQAEQQDPKYSEEIQPYVFDFSPYLGRTESLKTVTTVEVIPLGDATRDPAADEMRFGEPRIVGTRVLQYFRDGVPGVSYYLRCRCETSIGRQVVSEIRLRIYRGTGARVSNSSPVVD